MNAIAPRALRYGLAGLLGLALLAACGRAEPPLDSGGVPERTAGSMAAVTEPPPEPAAPPVITYSLREVAAQAAQAVVQITTPSRVGSGFVFDERGWVLTSAGVVGRFEDVAVLVNGKNVAGRVIGVVADAGLAVIWFHSDRNQAALKLGDSDTIRPGDAVVVLAYPEEAVGGADLLTTAGSIVTRTRLEGRDYLVTDAFSGTPGDGRPLLDRTGSVVGIATLARPSPSAVAGPVGVATPINQAKVLMFSLQAGGALLSAPTTARAYDGKQMAYTGVFYEEGLRQNSKMTLSYIQFGGLLSGFVEIANSSEKWGGPIRGTLEGDVIKFRLDLPASGGRYTTTFTGQVLDGGAMDGYSGVEPTEVNPAGVEGTWRLSPVGGP